MSNDESLDSVREQYELLLQKSGGKIVRLSPDHKNKINQLVETNPDRFRDGFTGCILWRGCLRVRNCKARRTADRRRDTSVPEAAHCIIQTAFAGCDYGRIPPKQHGQGTKGRAPGTHHKVHFHRNVDSVFDTTH